ncbi:MAG: DUF4136 domain-containing protein [Flavobacteriaceae bacterium]|nr:DUF4136 domain-containing protein [Flavobacteriaceae bacterium]
MKKIILILTSSLLLASCSSVRVNHDYDVTQDFTTYTTYAFLKEGIDRVEISDLDKKRILRAIDRELQQKGLQKSESPDLVINFMTEANERVDVYNNWGYWGPYWGGYWGPTTTVTVEGTLFIDFIDNTKKQLVWQGVGTAPLRSSPQGKTDRINEMVQRILAQFPPSSK